MDKSDPKNLQHLTLSNFKPLSSWFTLHGNPIYSARILNIEEVPCLNISSNNWKSFFLHFIFLNWINLYFHALSSVRYGSFTKPIIHLKVRFVNLYFFMQTCCRTWLSFILHDEVFFVFTPCSIICVKIIENVPKLRFCF